MNKSKENILGLFTITASMMTFSLPVWSYQDELHLAEQELINGNVDRAYELLLPHYADGSVDEQLLFVMALSAKDAGNYDLSEKHLQEIIEQNPHALRVKLELAEVYYFNGNPRKATQLLHEVKAANPPARVGENIDAFLAFIASGETKKWNLGMSLGLLYDTNVNQGPNTDTILIFGLPFTLNNDAKPNRDWASQLRISFDHTHPLDDRLSFQSTADIQWTDYQEIDEFDVMNTSLSAGPSWRKSNWLFSVPYVFNILKVGHEASYYTVSHGIAPQFGYAINRKTMFQGNLAYQEKRYKENKQRDSHSTTINLNLRYAINNHSSISMGGYGADEHSETTTSSNHSYGLHLGFQHNFNKKWSIYFSPRWGETDYGGTELAYGKSRKDERTDLSSNIAYSLNDWNSTLVLSHHHTRNDSNIDIYSHKRDQTSLTFRKSF